jgi:hypothetical protein
VKNLIFILFSGLLLLSCSKSPDEKVANLTGYWEIERAELPEGITKEFKYSPLVDYIEVKKDSGFRTKVRPQLGGKFLASGDTESFIVKVENDSINLYYTTPYNHWKETVISASDEEIKIVNSKGIIYTYKKFTPYSSDYGQEK